MMSLFRDRKQAGRRLAAELSNRRFEADPVVLGLARGGMPVACEVARRLEAPLDVFVVRKLGVPYQPELAFGAVASGGVRILNDDIVRAADIYDGTIERVTERELRELRRREREYRSGQSPVDVEHRTVILVDDGIATGASMTVAIQAIRRKNPAQIVAACPVAARRSKQKVADEVDKLVVLSTPEPFGGVGAWYDDFSETTDEDVRRLLASHPPTASPGERQSGR